MSRERTYRPLTASEIDCLEASGCRSASWASVQVCDGFRPETLAAVRFVGENRLGRLDGPEGGICNATLVDCTVGDNVRIENIRRRIVRMDIEDGVVIEDAGLIAVEGESAFGHGVLAEVVNEGGGRAVPLFAGLTSQIAFFLAMYRDRPALQKALQARVDAETDAVRSTRGTVGAGAVIVGVGTLRNVRIGPSARIHGAQCLENGTVLSAADAPTEIGEGVVARDFIALEGAAVTDGALLTRTFVGQGVRIGRQFAAVDSLFFANGEAYHGEACSIFAGPYTVTHHKASLLIAGLYSFFNAGSATNQSNHMYKLGPMHQGVLERGAKFGSFGYVRWPCRIGPFCVVLGKHTQNFDAGDLPFSYLVEADGRSLAIPAANLFTVGVRRDGAKWPKRDRRTGARRADLVHTPVFSPYTMERIARGRALLRDALEKSVGLQESVYIHGLLVPRSRLQKGVDAYETALRLFVGEQLVPRVERLREAGTALSLEALFADAPALPPAWTDVGGLLAPRDAVEAVVHDVEAGASLATVRERLQDLFDRYEDLAWRWTASWWLREHGKTAATVTAADVVGAVQAWVDAADVFQQRLVEDAAKEFDEAARIGYGASGDPVGDFAAVRGDLKSHPFVAELAAQTERVHARAAQARSELEAMA